MSTPIQMIHIHYKTKSLLLLDSDNKTSLYTVKVCRETPQMQLVRLNRSPDSAHGNAGFCTASFKMLSMDVKLSLHGHEVHLQRLSAFTRTYGFESIALQGSTLHWEADGALTGDFKLVDQDSGQILSRFRNRLWTVEEVGSFEMVGNLSDTLKEEIAISGLAVLVMVQSLNLAGMVLMGST
ncbi:hypothetical protein N7536_001604 [Penicillium majusculum]|uniref:Tubby C-terminal domain-containing protein n=1 Tax=Penicillium solitum TaxID=60172 RepID=A0A1V6R1M3_9EURO|nr:uncharacterized protein PENSOL_c020G07169 [Penicillium solitum]KAJ5705915.1 hypothetical protein N7536_001604 [Penicillium majusculum]OQD95370.1 hypothetical protein PENSOL_c020G07169 [Penicillium solitum]